MRTLVESGGSRSKLEGLLHQYLSELPGLRAHGDVRNVAATLAAMGRIHVRLHEWDLARESFREAEASIGSEEADSVRAALDLGRAEMHLQSGALDRAREILQRLIAELDGSAKPELVAEAETLLGTVYRRDHNNDAALEHLRHAASLSRSSGATWAEAEAESERALVLQDEGRNREAMEALVRARQLFDELRMSTEAHSLQRRLSWLEHTHLQVVKAWGASIESKDRYTAGHCDRVARYTCMLAEAVGLAEKELSTLRIGAFLHDVGKTAVPAPVLNKAGKLDEGEWELMKSHTVVGDEMIAELHFPWDIRPIVRSHHERWDGTGYPDGLGGEDIPLTARILCVADVFDALTTTRSYRAALSRSEALQIMADEAGHGLDPSLYDVFASRIQERSSGGIQSN